MYDANQMNGHSNGNGHHHEFNTALLIKSNGAANGHSNGHSVLQPMIPTRPGASWRLKKRCATSW